MDTAVHVHSIGFGTGFHIFTDTILQAIEAAQSEVILITCFWARSQTRDALSQSLRNLSITADRDGRRIRVRIGFSSSSLLQKLFHTSNPSGRIYPSEKWGSLGLPGPSELTGLDLEVKSVFFLPFSVWHPKFVIVDRETVILPSCNVSWENWLEGYIQFSGPLVLQFVEFWRMYWASGREWNGALGQDSTGYSGPGTAHVGLFTPEQTLLLASRKLDVHTNSKFLSSPHSRNPRFRLPWQRCAPPPNTPLNRQLLELLRDARRKIFLQTPNLTSRPVLDALLDALKRGVDVEIVTSERLMILEQLITAGTTTSRCVKRLTASYDACTARSVDEEARLVAPGRLQLSYYEPRSAVSRDVDEPQQSHVKLTIVDEEVMVFGSGNMDRASWYTSQELGVAFASKELVSQVNKCLDEAMDGRTKVVCDTAQLSIDT